MQLLLMNPHSFSLFLYSQLLHVLPHLIKLVLVSQHAWWSIQIHRSRQQWHVVVARVVCLGHAGWVGAWIPGCLLACSVLASPASVPVGLQLIPLQAQPQ